MLSGRNPTAKSPEGDSHEVVLSVAVRQLPTVTLPLLCAIEEIVSRTSKKTRR